MSRSDLRIFMAKELDRAWKESCKTNMMESSFRHVGLSLNIDGMMKFQGQPPGKPGSIKI